MGHSDGQWRQFSGDQIGAMLGVWLFRKYKHAERPIGVSFTARFAM